MKDLIPFLRLLGRHRGWMTGGAVLALVTWAASVALLGISGWFLTGAAIAGLTAATAITYNVLQPSAGIRLFALTRTLSRYGERVVSHEATFRALADLRTWVFAQAIPLAPAKLGTLQGGDLLNRITGDVDALDGLYLRVVVPSGVAAIALVTVTIVLALIDPAMAFAYALLFLAVALAVPVGAARAGRPAAQATIAATMALRQHAVEGVRGLADLMTLGRLADHGRNVDAAGERLIAAQARLAHLAGLAAASVTLATGGAVLIVLWLGVPQVADASMPGPILALAAFVTLAAFEAAAPLATGWGQLGRLTQAAHRLLALSRTAPAISPPEHPRMLPTGDLTLAFEQVRFAYPGTERPVLAGVDLTLAPGDRVALVGESGIGKSTLAHLALRFWDPDAGRVTLGGVPLTEVDLAALRRRVGLLSQRPDLFAASIGDNLRLGWPDAPEGALWKALEEAQLGAFVRGLPEGLDTPVGEQGVSLSGGQGRRLALARLILADPAIWVLDEPTQGLDAGTEAALWETLNRATADRTVLLIAHAGIGLDRMDRRLRLVDGRLHPA